MENLDCMTREELWAFWNKHKFARTAKQLFPDRPKGYVVATRNLANYACNKSVAMACRERGDIDAASMYERIADRIYARDLPEYAKW